MVSGNLTADGSVVPGRRPGPSAKMPANIAAKMLETLAKMTAQIVGTLITVSLQGKQRRNRMFIISAESGNNFGHDLGRNLGHDLGRHFGQTRF